MTSNHFHPDRRSLLTLAQLSARCALALLLVPLAALAETDRLSVVAVPAVDGSEGPQVAVKWSGELPVRLEVGLVTGEGGFTATSPPVVLTESMTLLPQPGADADKSLTWRVTDGQSQTLAQMKGSSPAFEWKAEPFEPGFDAEVLAVTVYQGELIAGGLFTEIGGETVNYIARWDGSAWSALSGPSGVGVNNFVVALTVHDGDLYAGGWFTTAGGVTVNRIARWDGSEWSALSGSLGTGVNSVVVALAGHGDDLIVGGHFVTAGGVTVNRIARWDGSAWSALSGPSGVGVDNSVFALTAHDGDLYAGGWFTTAGGVTVNNIARWDGSAWSALPGSPDPGVNHQVNALTVYDGDLVASGAFSTAGGVTVNRIARWDGSEWSALSGPSGTGVNGSALVLTVHNGDLIAGGWFTTAGGVTVNRIARWDDSDWSALTGPSGTGVNDGFRALTVLDGDLIAGGNFTSAGGVPSTRIGRYGIAFFTVGGTVSGLVGSGLVLQNNGGDDLAINANGPYSFATALEDLSSYAVTVLNQPSNPSQTCSVANASGTLAGAKVTNVVVTCTTNQFTVGGTVTGLTGDQVVLQNNSGDSQVITADGGFTFAAQDDGSAYDIAVLSQPGNPSQTCSVANGSGTLAAANVTNVEVTCTTNQFTVGGTVTGLTGDQVVLQNNGGDNQVITADGGFTFAAQDDVSSYDVTVLSQPDNPSQTCSVANGSGTLAGANVTNVEITCTTNPPPEIVTVFAAPGGELEDCVELSERTSALVVSFSEPMADPPGDSEPEDVTNPSNYQLIATGPDNDLDTFGCDALRGDDVLVAPASVTFDGLTHQATVSFAPRLGDGFYRLLVCDSLEALTGSVLEEEFVVSFRQDADNLLTNGHFDCDLAGWELVSTTPEEIEYSPEDADDALVSGSVQMTDLSGTSFGIEQCVNSTESSYRVGGSVRIDGGANVLIGLTTACSFFAQADCLGAVLGQNGSGELLQETADLWQPWQLTIEAPAASAAARCSVSVDLMAGGMFDAFLDDLTVVGSLFSDGFESGDASRWSSSTP